MANLFLVLFFISLICLIIGLIDPSIFTYLIKKEVAKKKIGLIFGTALLVFFVLTGVTYEPKKIKPETGQVTKTEQINEIKILGKTIKVGDSADNVFNIITDDYKIDSQTIGSGKVVHHFLVGKTLFDMIFEKDETDSYYVLTGIIIKNENYQVPEIEKQSPVQYEIGYTSGFLAVISVPQGTTKTQLKELLNYFHSLKEEGKLSKIMKGHTVIDIFDNKKWTTKENYNSIILNTETYCNYIKATYGVDIQGVESASISFGDCPNYEKVKLE